MAIWQFDVCILPRQAPCPTRGPDGYDAAPIGAPQAARALAWCAERWPQQEWMDGWRVFGEDQGCRIDVLACEDGGGSAELLARIDMRTAHADFCQSVYELATLLGCTLFSPELWCTVRPELNDLLAAAGRSRAARFAQEPQAVLREASQSAG